MTSEQIDARIMSHIRAMTRAGTGVRTTEMRTVEEQLDLGCGEAHFGQLACDAIGRLVEAGKIVFCTEKFRELDDGSWTGDYCWIVPADHPINEKRHGYFHVTKVPVPPDRVWNLPREPSCWQGRA